MKNNKSIILLFSALILANFLLAQTEMILQNGDFEKANAYPTDHNQLTNNFDGWEEWSATADWYTTQNLPNAYRGGCEFIMGSLEEVRNATPKVSTYNGSNYYGGFGTSELMYNNLSRNTYKSSKVKIAFWFSPRGTYRNTQIFMNLICKDCKNSASMEPIPLIYVDVKKGVHLPCKWYYYESDWFKTGDDEYNMLTFGGGTTNPAGDIQSPGYIYVDDIKLWNGRDCCVDDILFENTSSLPAGNTAGNNIKAGYNVGSMSVDGNVTVLNGQNVTFTASNIYLEPGFSVQPGGLFSAEIGNCNPFTKPNGSAIEIQNLPNVFTPNGDGINDLYLVTASGVQSFTIEIWNRDGVKMYEYEGPISSPSPFIVWDGYCNRTFCSGKVVDGTYSYVLHLQNCTNDIVRNGFIQVFTTKSLHEVTDSTHIQNNIIADNSIVAYSNEISIYPNPATNNFTIDPDGLEISSISITNMLGQLAYESKEILTTPKVVDLSDNKKGIFSIHIISNKGSETFKIVLQ